MKYSLITMKPNVMRRTFFSQILGMNLRIWVSMKARRTIMKRGSFDSYIMRTKPEHLDSKFGLYLRNLMRQKQKNPQFTMPIIPGQATQPRTRKTKHWEYRNIPSIYLPSSVNLQEDQSKYYLKTPQEMSRYEIAELEREIRDMNEGEEEPVQDEASLEEMRKDPDFKLFLSEMKKLTKLRHAVIKRYFEKNKFKRASRNEIIEAAEESEIAI